MEDDDHFSNLFKEADKLFEQAKRKMLKSMGPIANASSRFFHAINLWSVGRKNLETTLLVSANFHTIENASKKKIHANLLFSALFKNGINHCDGVIFDSPDQLRRLADQVSSVTKRLRQIATELEEKQIAAGIKKEEPQSEQKEETHESDSAKPQG